MSQKNDIPVVINNKVYTLSGFESEEYLQNVASYINGKIQECQSSESYIRVYYLHLISQMIISRQSFR
jgi:cell division protein ZapA